MVRLSMLTPSKLQSADSTRADKAWVNSLKVSALSMGHLPCGQGVIGLHQIGESMAFAVDFLIVLVTFTGQHHHVVSTCAADQLGDGCTASGNERRLGRIFKADTNVIENLAWVFAARVVVSDQNAIGQAFDDFSHQRALAAIAVTATAEQAQQLALGVGTQGL